MSRSRRRPILIMGGGKSARKEGHRKMRAAVRDALHHERFDVIPEDESQFVNDFDVIDYRFDMRFGDWSHWDIPRATRK